MATYRDYVWTQQYSNTSLALGYGAAVIPGRTPAQVLGALGADQDSHTEAVGIAELAQVAIEVAEQSDVAGPNLTVGVAAVGADNTLLIQLNGGSFAVTEELMRPLPTNPLWWEPAAARSASPAPELTPESIPTGTNSAGQTYGSGASAATDADLPDLVAAIGDDGTTVGFVRSADLAETPAANPAAASAPSAGAERSIPLFNEDGQTQVGTFTLT